MYRLKIVYSVVDMRIECCVAKLNVSFFRFNLSQREFFQVYSKIKIKWVRFRFQFDFKYIYYNENSENFQMEINTPLYYVVYFNHFFFVLENIRKINKK